jgi:hypothetical protein
MGNKSPLLNEYLVKVKENCSAYVVRAHGITASCTTGAQQAVERLAAKLWGEGEHPCYAQPSGDWLIKRDLKNHGLHPKHFVHTWTKVEDFLPDADLVVLVCVPAASEPVWLGYLDGEDWRYVDATLIERDGIKVAGWSDLPAPMEAR